MLFFFIFLILQDIQKKYYMKRIPWKLEMKKLLLSAYFLRILNVYVEAEKAPREEKGFFNKNIFFYLI
jgi:hypothetical protein